jgi:hypothetical protein
MIDVRKPTTSLRLLKRSISSACMSLMVGTATCGEVVRSCVSGQVIAESEAEVVTIALWGFGHGLASLWTDGQLAKQAAELDRTADTLVEQTLALLECLLGA